MGKTAMPVAKLSGMIAIVGMTLLVHSVAIAGEQEWPQRRSKPECLGAPGAVPTQAGTTPAAHQPGPPDAIDGIAPAFNECGIGGFPQSENDQRGTDKRHR